MHDDQEAPPSTTPASAARATRARASKALPVSAVVRELEIGLNKFGKELERMKRLQIGLKKMGKQLERIARLLKQGGAR